jgi:hypothetical protein
LRLKAPVSAKVAAQPALAPPAVANGHPPQQPKAKVPRPSPPPPDPPQWVPGRTVNELRAQLPDLVVEVHPVFGLGVVPLALGAGPALVEVARPGRRQRIRRWITAWCRSDSYLQALAAEGAMRHDRRGVPVEPVEPEHAEVARRRLEWLAWQQRRQPGAPR